MILKEQNGIYNNNNYFPKNIIFKKMEKETKYHSLAFSQPAIDYFHQMEVSQQLADTILHQHSTNQPAPN